MAITVAVTSPANIQKGTSNVIAINVDGANRLLSAGSVPLAATGGTAPYSWQLAGGLMPPGVRLDPSGVITGMPTQRGSALVLVRATDSAAIPNFADQWLEVDVQ